MGGSEGSRGYLYQAITAVVGALTEENWSKIYVEFPTSNDKVDIAFANEDTVQVAIQVKSSINPLSKSDLILWIKALIKDVYANEYQIYIIGQYAPAAITFIKSIQKFYDSTMDAEAKESLKTFDINILKNKIFIKQLNFDQEALLAAVRDKLHHYISTKGYTIRFDVLELLSESMVTQKMLLATNGEYITKKDFDNKIFQWVSLSSGNALKRSEGFSTHIVGMYDLEKKNVFSESPPINIETWLPYCSLIEKIKEISIKIISKVQALNTPVRPDEELEAEENERREKSKKAMEKYLSPYAKKVLTVGTNGNHNLVPFDDSKFRESIEKMCSRQQSKISSDYKTDIIEKSASLLGISLTNDFFELGSLQQETSLIDGTTFYGTGDEKLKRELIYELNHQYLLIDILKLYSKTYQGIIIVPLAIWNNSSFSDEDITVSLITDEAYATIISPNRFSVCDEANGLEGILHDEGIIKKIFELRADESIYIEEEQMPYVPTKFTMQSINIWGRANVPKSTKEDYENDLDEYIVTPTTKTNFNYHINSIRAGEKMWLSKIALLSVKQYPITIKYDVKSKKSDGSLNGFIVINKPLE